MCQISFYLHVHTHTHVCICIYTAMPMHSEEIKQLWRNLVYHDRNYRNREVAKSPFLKGFKRRVDVALGSWFSGGPGSVSFKVDLSDFGGLFHSITEHYITSQFSITSIVPSILGLVSLFV